MKVYYKTAVDYKKTLLGMAVGDEVEVKLADCDISVVRTAVCKVARNIAATFSVHRSETGGAMIRRTA